MEAIQGEVKDEHFYFSYEFYTKNHFIRWITSFNITRSTWRTVRYTGVMLNLAEVDKQELLKRNPKPEPFKIISDVRCFVQNVKWKINERQALYKSYCSSYASKHASLVPS